MQIRRGGHGASALILGLALIGGAAADTQPAAPSSPTVLITGSNRGIGLALANAYAAQSWHVIATCRDPEHANELRALRASHPNVVIETLDVVNSPSVSALAAKYHGQPIDVLINNAGIAGNYDGQLLGHFDEATFNEVMRVNTFAPMLVSSAFLDNVALSGQKKLVTISSARGSIGTAREDHRVYFYDMSKASINMGMKLLASEVRSRGVLIGILTPGPVDTDLNRAARNGGPPPPELISPTDSAARLVKLIDQLSPATSAHFINYKGEEVPW